MPSVILQMKQNLMVALLCSGLISCGGTGFGNQSSDGSDTAGSNFVTLISPGTEDELIHLRWFPQDTDISYTVNFRRLDHSVTERFAIEPTGCTSAAKSGYTSGICTVDLPMSHATDYEVAIEAENGNLQQKGDKRQQDKFAPITRY